jgi:hypothetical protein
MTFGLGQLNGHRPRHRARDRDASAPDAQESRTAKWCVALDGHDRPHAQAVGNQPVGFLLVNRDDSHRRAGPGV